MSASNLTRRPCHGRRRIAGRYPGPRHKPLLPAPTVDMAATLARMPGEYVVPGRLTPAIRMGWRVIDPWVTDQQMEALHAFLLLAAVLDRSGRLVQPV